MAWTGGAGLHVTGCGGDGDVAQ